MRRVIVLVSIVGLAAATPASPQAVAQRLSGLPSRPFTDFNGDGYADLAIGVPNEDRIVDHTGGVHVLHGTAMGLEPCCGPTEYLTQGSNGLTDTEEAEDRFGSSLATGEFNGDDFSDLAIGVPGQDIGGQDMAGAVHIVYGSSLGLQADSPDDQVFTQDSAGVGDQAEAGDEFGHAVATGDFNGDGFDDLGVGAWHEEVSGISHAGAVNVLYGSESGLQTSAPDDLLLHQDRAGVEDAAEDGDTFGASLTAGDFDGSGIDDLAIGVPSEDIAATDQGAVNVLYGNLTGLETTAPADQFWHQDRPGVNQTGEARDNFGAALAAGDFSSDGADDLAIGVDLEDFGAAVDTGAVNVIRGHPGEGLLAGLDQLWHQNRPGVRGVVEHYDRFSGALATGNFNGDSYDDLAVGVPGDTIVRPSAGAVNVLDGSKPGLQAANPDDQLWSQQVSADVRGRPEAFDSFGFALATGDFDLSGEADMAVGIPGENGGGEGFPGGGAVGVLYSDASGLQATNPDDELWHEDSPAVGDVPESGDGFGRTLG